MNYFLTKETFDSNPVISSTLLDLNDSVQSAASLSLSLSSTSSSTSNLGTSLEQEEKEQQKSLMPLSDSKRERNFAFNNVLNSTHHPFTINSKSAYTSYFYTNTNTILNKFVMSYEEQLHKAIVKGNFELCNELILKNCDVNVQFNKKFPLCLACEHNFFEIAELLIKVGI